MASSRFLFVCTACMLLMAASQIASGQLLNASTDQGPAANGAVFQHSHAAETMTPSGSTDVRQAGWFNLPMPKVTMPRITMPKVTMPSMASTFAPLAAGARTIGDGSKKAWEGAKGMLNFGRGQSTGRSPHAVKKKPSMWKRMFTPKEPDAPRTVAEWMSQPRLKP